MTISNYSAKQTGQSMVEFIIVTPVMLMLLFGALQFAFLYHAKITLNYATYQTARAGAVSNASMFMMEDAFARSMAPIYTHDDDVEEVKNARDVVRQEIASNFVNIQVLNPTPATFADFGVPANGGLDVEIPNNNLMYRPDTVGASSGLTVQDANLLKIRISYCYPMYVPYIDRVLTILLTQPAASCDGCTGAFTSTTTFERGCLENDRFPLHAQAIMRMQSPASLAAINTGTYGGPAASTLPPNVTDYWTLSSSEQP